MKYILQIVSGDMYERMVEIAAPMNLAWADAHGYQIETRRLMATHMRTYAHICGPRNIYWAKLNYAMELLRGGASTVLILDCDAVIVDPEMPEPPGDWDLAGHRSVYRVINTGALWLRSGAVEFLTDVIETGPLTYSPFDSGEQATLNARIPYHPALKVKELGREYNEYEGAVGNSVWTYIRAWHGLGPEAAIREMTTYWPDTERQRHECKNSF